MTAYRRPFAVGAKESLELGFPARPNVEMPDDSNHDRSLLAQPPRRPIIAAERALLMSRDMAISKQLRQYAAARVTRRLIRAVPWIGGIVALVTLGSAIRRKGFLGGSLDTALDMIPFVGGAKNLAEIGRGRDFIRDKQRLAG
jgi:hypothetical protein